MVAMTEGQMYVAGLDGTWQDVGYGVFEIKYEAPKYEVADQQLQAYMRSMTAAFRDVALSFEMTRRQLRKLWPILTGFGPLDGPPPMEPGMVTWPTRRKRKRRK